MKMNRIIFALSALLPAMALTLPEAGAQQVRELSYLGDTFDRYGVDGSILLFDTQSGDYAAYNAERCSVYMLPASTFKLVSTLVGLETGVIKSDQSFKWDGQRYGVREWERDMDLVRAFRVSNVPVYQEIVRSIGAEKMREYVRRFEYGSMDINDENLDRFWLEGSSGVTQYGQIEFLRKLHYGTLPVGWQHSSTLKYMMRQEDKPGYMLCGKTGTVTSDQMPMGWYVGYVESADNICFFATNIVPFRKDDVRMLSQMAQDLTCEILLSLGYMPVDGVYEE